jgi:hypothetical protein
MGAIERNVKTLLREVPSGVTVVAAAKTRVPEEVLEAVVAGIGAVGENYVQEAERAIEAIGRRCRWHLIGHLQRNKAARAAALFDLVETVDSLSLGEALDRACGGLGKTLPVLVEVNSGREPRKSGVVPEEVEGLVRSLAGLPHLEVLGLMTMGPETSGAEDLRPAFRETRRLFDDVGALAVPRVQMEVLSMGMTGSWRVAVEEGSTMIRIGTGIFGERRQA